MNRSQRANLDMREGGEAEAVRMNAGLLHGISPPLISQYELEISTLGNLVQYCTLIKK